MKLPDRTKENMLSGPRTRGASPGAGLAQIQRSFRLGATERAYPLHALLLALALAGCKHVSELQVASHTDAATAAEVSTHEVISTGPEHIIMTVEEYEQLCPAPEMQAPTTPVPTIAVTGQNLQQLIRRTVTVTDRGPSLDDLRSLSSRQSKVNTALEVKAEQKSGPAGLLGLLGGLWPVVLIGGAILAGFVVWKLRPPWLSFLFKLLGKGS